MTVEGWLQYCSKNLFIRSFARSALSSSESVKYIDPVRLAGSRPASRAILATSAHCSAQASGLGVIGSHPSNERPTWRRLDSKLPPTQIGGPPARCGVGARTPPFTCQRPSQLTLCPVIELGIGVSPQASDRRAA